MKNEILYVGIDVDDKHFHIAALSKGTGEFFQRKCKPTSGGLIKVLNSFKEKGFKVKCCYEATYCGYNLQRTLSKQGFETEVIAPGSILKQAGKRIKTDKIDAQILAEQYANGQLKTVHVPSEEEQNDRALVRSRRFLVETRKRLRAHILSVCRMADLNFFHETGAKSHWTKTHEQWLRNKVKTLPDSLRKNLELLLAQLDEQNETINRYDEEIEALSESKRYKEKKEALTVFRGIQTLTAMTFITELGDIKRFSHPSQLSSYCGMDITEYSSGGKERKYGITKLGNAYLRTAAVESVQGIQRFRAVGKTLKERRKQKPVEQVRLAEACEKRLKKRANHLLDRGKPVNKVKVAVAREFMGFVWAALTQVA